MGLQKAFVGQQRLCHLGKGHPQRKGGHVLAAGKVEVDDVVGALQIFDVREGQGPQPRRRRDRDDRAILRLGGAVKQSGELFGPERNFQILHRVHPERLVSVGRGAGEEGQRSAHPVLAQLGRRL